MSSFNLSEDEEDKSKNRAPDPASVKIQKSSIAKAPTKTKHSGSTITESIIAPKPYKSKKNPKPQSPATTKPAPHQKPNKASTQPEDPELATHRTVSSSRKKQHHASTVSQHSITIPSKIIAQVAHTAVNAICNILQIRKHGGNGYRVFLLGGSHENAELILRSGRLFGAGAVSEWFTKPEYIPSNPPSGGWSFIARATSGLCTFYLVSHSSRFYVLSKTEALKYLRRQGKEMLKEIDKQLIQKSRGYCKASECTNEQLEKHYRKVKGEFKARGMVID